MFYSHEILTSRKYGVATVWLVATLGAKSSGTKKITRKAILDVDVRKACETIMEPEAPMALRLQSNLLYGVSRVYHQQCGYVLQDAQAAQFAMRSLIKASRNNQLDASAGNARPELLLLLDDPAFLPENALPPLDFDFDLAKSGTSQRSTQSLMSIRARGGSGLDHSSPAASVLGLNLPSSCGNSGYQLPDLNGFGDTAAHKNYGGLGRDLEEEELFENDNLFGFNEDGELLDLPEAEREALRSGAVLASAEHRRSGSAASRVRKEHEDAFCAPFIVGEDDFFMPYGDDDIAVLPDAEPFDVGKLPLMAGGLGGDDQPQRHPSQDLVFSEEESSVSAQAPQKRKPNVKKKNLVVDSRLEIKSSEMKAWQTAYLARMAATCLIKEQHKANTQAKKNAFHFVLGGGLNGVGGGVGSSTILSPLDIFSGESLLALLTAKSPAPDTSKRGKKRLSEDGPSPPAKRSRDSELGRGASPSNNNNVLEDDGGILNIEDDQSQYIELGRKAGSALPDHPSSALMPWNKSASLNSHQRNASSQHGRHVGVLGGHRLASASPLIGRGSNLPADIDQFSIMHEEDGPMNYNEDGGFGSAAGLDFGAGGGGGPSSSHGRDTEFEIFGQAANVDTQTAGTSQWVRDALDKESNNFFEYVRNTIEERQSDELAESPVVVAGDQQKSVTFRELFNVEGNSAIVAAQAFYHVLCLATKGRVWVEQDEIRDQESAPVPFGEIKIGVVEAMV